MNAAIINTVVPRAARIDAPATATAKTPDDGRFGETLKAGVAAEAPVETTPATLATPSVGKVPVAMMRPPDVSSPDDAVVMTATKAQKPQQNTSQDTGAVSVVVEDDVLPGAAEAGAVPQQSAQPLVANTVPLRLKGKAQAAELAVVRDKAKPEVIAKKDAHKSDAATPAATCDAGPAAVQHSAVVLPGATTPVPVDPKIQEQIAPEAAPIAVRDAKEVNILAKTPGAAVKKVDSKAANTAGSETAAAATGVIPIAPAVSAVTSAVIHAVGAAAITWTGHTAPTPTPMTTSTTSIATKVAGSVALSSPAAAVPSAASTDLRTLVSTPNVLEIGFASGSHGWLRVRAELDGTGDVAASVVAATAGAAEGLHKELPGLSQYLEREHVALSSLVVNASGKGTETLDAAASAGGNEAPAGGRQGSDKKPAQEDAGLLSGNAGIGAESSWPQTQVPAAMLSHGSGSWLSVRV